MITSDKIKFAHTPSEKSAIGGAGQKDIKRLSRWTSRTDVAQSVTGLILGLFLFCHMAFTSSVVISKDLFYNLIQTSGGAFIFEHEQLWLHVLFIGFVTVCVIIHALCALRRFPTSYRQCREICAHVRFLRHQDTTLWFIQLVTAVIITAFVFPHLMGMLFHPSGIDPNLSGVHTYEMGYLWTFFFLAAVELHGMIGLYRLAVKWDVVKGRCDGLRKGMLIVAALMIACGANTAYTYWSIGEHQVTIQEAATPYVPAPENSWYK